MGDELRVVAAAVLGEDGTIYSLPPPARHDAILRECFEKSGKRATEQGFLLSDGRFARRKPALMVARKAGQVLRETAPQHGLFSEDVW